MGEVVTLALPRRMRPAAPGPARHGYSVVSTEFDHLREINGTMREADRREIEGLGVTVRQALWRAWRSSVMCRTGLVDGRVAAVWGLCVAQRPGVSLLSRTGVPWLHTTAAVERVPVGMVREARANVAAMLALYPRLENYVAADYAQAVRLLRLLGFTIDAPQPVGRDGAPYCLFHMDRE